MSAYEECKLNTSADWEDWRRHFQSTARSFDLWDVVQRQEAPIRKPAEPNLASYPLTVPLAAQTRAQSQAANQGTEDTQSTVQQEPQGPIEFAHLTAAGQKSFTAASSIYENKLKAYNIQRQGIQKLTDLVNRTVSRSYLRNCCDPNDNIDTWYANLKRTAGTSASQEFNNARDRYHKALRPLTKIKDYEKWIIEWESALAYAQSKDVGEASSTLSWTKDLFSAVRQVLPEWVNSYRLFSREKVEAGTLNFRDTANDLRTAAIDLAQQTKPTRIGRGSFGPTFAGEEADPLQEDALDKDDEGTSRRKRRKLKGESTTEKRPLAIRGGRTSDSRDQSSSPPRRLQCRGCGGRHYYSKCFYLLPHLAPKNWYPRPETVILAKKALDEDDDLAKEIKKLRSAEEKKKKKDED